MPSGLLVPGCSTKDCGGIGSHVLYGNELCCECYEKTVNNLLGITKTKCGWCPTCNTELVMKKDKQFCPECKKIIKSPTLKLVEKIHKEVRGDKTKTPTKTSDVGEWD